jgi:hypothetical protein
MGKPHAHALCLVVMRAAERHAITWVHRLAVFEEHDMMRL